jgi:hypothetical protein
MLDKIEALQRELNAKQRVPCRAYRRNVSVYELVCYVNNITGCFLSNNINPIPVFIKRAKEYMEENQKAELKDYFILVTEYLTAIEEHIDRRKTEKNNNAGKQISPEDW